MSGDIGNWRLGYTFPMISNPEIIPDHSLRTGDRGSNRCPRSSTTFFGADK